MSALTGYVGVDPQRAHTAVMLREPPRPPAAVGDGYRRLVPNAVSSTAWGSAAAATPADPWSAEFLTGLRRRLYGYLGRLEPLSRNGYRILPVRPPDQPDGAVGERFAAAGLPDAEPVDPADALVARWLASGAEPGPVVAVVCGEGWTLAAAYRLHDGRLRCRRGAARITAPATDLTAGLLAEIRDRCREEPPADEVFAAAEGIFEYAARMRAVAGPVTWNGPLTDRMFEPLVRSREWLAAQSGVITSTTRLRRLVDRVRDGEPAGTVVVGGTGSIWPVVAATLRTGPGDAGPGMTAPVWQSREPELDLATGAAWWPAARHLFAESAMPRQYPVMDEPPDVHPWLRRSA